MWGITGSLLLVLAVYRGGPQAMCELSGGCVDSAVRNILLPRKNYRTVTAPPQPPTCDTVQSYNLLEFSRNL